MKRKNFLSILGLTLLYFIFIVIFLLYFRNVLLGWALIPWSLQQIGLKTIKTIFSLGFFQNPPEFIKPFLVFIFFELPILIATYVLFYVLLRKKFARKVHLFAIIISLVLIFSFGLFSFKPKIISGHKIPTFFSISEGLRNLKCKFVSDEVIFNWTYPKSGQEDVSVYSPIVINFRKDIHFPNGCSVY